jgi:hypothetical protein
VDLNCERAKIEFGQVLKTSLQGDFKSHDITLGVGVGVTGDAPGLSAGGKAMLEVTFDSNGQFQDLAVTGKLSATVGATGKDMTGVGVTGEISGRMSLSDGPISASTSVKPTLNLPFNNPYLPPMTCPPKTSPGGWPSFRWQTAQWVAGGPAFRRQTTKWGPVLRGFSRRVGDRLIAPWALPNLPL